MTSCVEIFKAKDSQDNLTYLLISTQVTSSATRRLISWRSRVARTIATWKTGRATTRRATARAGSLPATRSRSEKVLPIF